MDLVSKKKSLLFNILSMLVTIWLSSPSALILEPKKMNSDTVSTFYPSICNEMIGSDAMILVFMNVEF